MLFLLADAADADLVQLGLDFQLFLNGHFVTNTAATEFGIIVIEEFFLVRVR